MCSTWIHRALVLSLADRDGNVDELTRPRCSFQHSPTWQGGPSVRPAVSFPACLHPQQTQQTLTMPSSWTSGTSSERNVHGCTIRGVQVGPEARCRHYHGPRDIIAIRFACCGDWYPCHLCHAARAKHDARVWPRDAFDVTAVLCGACGHRLTIRNYLTCQHTCPACGAAFNPGCSRHRHLYFAPDAAGPPPHA